MPAEIVTFYSYKGGTGRSMALANIAWILASTGKRVLVLDWDLEAPGLHRYFHPFLEDKELTSSEGIIDFVLEFAAEALSPSGPHERDWHVPFANILRYASSLNWDFRPPQSTETATSTPGPPPPTLDFVPAGQQGSDYATRVNSFDWQKFYERLGGGVFLEAAKQSMLEYDYVLIDSRTGVSDTSGICTIQMPDTLVVCFTYNIQSIEGAAAVAESALQQRRNLEGEPTLRILPVPMRVEFAEKQKLDAAKETARERFDPLLWHLTDKERAEYWERVQVSYQPFYAYEETLATFGDKPREPDTLLSKMEIITEYLTGAVTRFPPLSSDPAIAEAKRNEWLAKFTRQQKMVKRAVAPGAAKYWFYLSFSRADANEYVRRFFADLRQEVSQYAGVVDEDSVGFADFDSIEPGDQWKSETINGLLSSRTMVCLYSPRYFNSEYCGKEFQVFRNRLLAHSESSLVSELPVILPVILTPWSKSPPKAVADLQYLDPDLPRTYVGDGLLYIMRLQKFRDDYEEFLSRFAMKLVQVARANELPPFTEVPELADVPNAFADTAPLPTPGERAGTPFAGPSTIECAFIAATQEEMRGVRSERGNYGVTSWDWKPFLPGDDATAAIMAQAVATQAGFRYRASPLGSDWMERLEEADRTNTIVIIVVDAWSLTLEHYANLMAEYDRRAFLNCGVLIVWNFEDLETAGHRAELEQNVRRRLSRQLLSSAPQFFRPNVQSAEDFKRELIQMLQALRFKIIERANLLRPVEGEKISQPSIVKPIVRLISK